MKVLLVTTLLFFTGFSLLGQQLYVEASINKNCVSQPGNISIEKKHEANSFKIIKINAGKNCYNGASINETGFTIKNGAGEIVFSNKSAKNLSDLKLSSGIYKVYVDGGRGAYFKLEYVLKLKISE